MLQILLKAGGIISALDSAYELGKKVINELFDDDEAPKTSKTARTRKPYDTHKFTQEERFTIHLTYCKWLATKHQTNKTLVDICSELNEVLSLNKSVTSYSRVYREYQAEVLSEGS